MAILTKRGQIIERFFAQCFPVGAVMNLEIVGGIAQAATEIIALERQNSLLGPFPRTDVALIVRRRSLVCWPRFGDWFHIGVLHAHHSSHNTLMRHFGNVDRWHRVHAIDAEK
jgi:hypothetical protein